MGRPRLFDEQQVARRVLRLVLRHGYDAVSVDDIVRGTGVGRGSLYQAFGSKAGLINKSLDLAIEEQHAERLEFAALLLASSASDDAALRATLARCLATFPQESLEQALGTALLSRLQPRKG